MTLKETIERLERVEAPPVLISNAECRESLLDLSAGTVVEVVECPPCILPTPFGEALTVIKELKARLETTAGVLGPLKDQDWNSNWHSKWRVHKALAATDLTLPFPKAE